jgi:MFS family permease
VSGPPSRWRRALRAVALDAGLLRRRRDYRLLMSGQFVSLAGSELTLVAIMFPTFQLTDSSLAVGLLGVAEFAPILVLALVGGALADAFDRRRLVALAESGAALVALALMVNALLPDPRLWVLYAGAALIAAFTALRRPRSTRSCRSSSSATSSRRRRRSTSPPATSPWSAGRPSPGCSSRSPASRPPTRSMR